MPHEIKLEGYGTIRYNPDSEPDLIESGEDCDINGKPLKWHAGKMASQGYFTNEEGATVPRTQACKKVEVNGEVKIVQRMTPTKEIEENKIKVEANKTAENTWFYAKDRKWYNIFTNSTKVKDVVLTQGKSLRFKVVVGAGFKMYESVLTAIPVNGSKQIVMVACRGDIRKKFEKYQEDMVEFDVGEASVDDVTADALTG